MKTFIIVFFTCIIFLAACKKDSAEGKMLITGKWDLRQSTGGIAGTIDYAPGTGLTIEFDNNSQYRFIYPPNVNGLARSGPYSLQKYPGSGDWLLQWQYVINNQTITQKDSVRLESNKLIFLPEQSCCDIPTITYVKLK